jgi:hypothetical protein
MYGKGGVHLRLTADATATFRGGLSCTAPAGSMEICEHCPAI